MDVDLFTWVFIIGGIILMLLEIFLPGGVALFLGVSGLSVGLLRVFGLFSDPITATFAWLFLSVALTIVIRPFMKKYFRGDTSFKVADEDYEAIDQIVDVVESVNDQNNNGRIRFQGISWQARTMDGEIPAGRKARITYRDNTTWIVEQVDDINSNESGIKNRDIN